MVSTQELNVFQDINKIKRENSAHVKPRREMSQIVPDCSGRSSLRFCGAIPSQGDNDSASVSV